MIDNGDLGNDDDFGFELEENKSEDEMLQKTMIKKKKLQGEMEDDYEYIERNELVGNNRNKRKLKNG